MKITDGLCPHESRKAKSYNSFDLGVISCVTSMSLVFNLSLSKSQDFYFHGPSTLPEPLRRIIKWKMTIDDGVIALSI
mgnify:CR=1 FL=1